jgi:hypothetical protein
MRNPRLPSTKKSLKKNAKQTLKLPDYIGSDMDYLLTWNCTHIANASMRHKIESICRLIGYEPPVICTPEELMEE